MHKWYLQTKWIKLKSYTIFSIRWHRITARRVVSNCSFQHGGKHVNQLLLRGPKLGPSLMFILLRFHEHIFALSSDIRRHVFSVGMLSLWGDKEIAFLTAHSRVSPMKQQSISHLELSAALTGAQLAKLLNSEFRTQCSHSSSHTLVRFCYRAGMVSSWIKVFVGVGVAENQELTDTEAWYYVDSKFNPAKGKTRG